MKIDIIPHLLACILGIALSANAKDGERNGVIGTIGCAPSKICEANIEAMCFTKSSLSPCPGKVSIPEMCPDNNCGCCLKKFLTCDRRCKFEDIEGHCYNPYDPAQKKACEFGTRYNDLNLCGSPTCSCCIPHSCNGTCIGSNGNQGRCVARKDRLTYNECSIGTYEEGRCNSKDCICHLPAKITIDINKP